MTILSDWIVAEGEAAFTETSAKIQVVWRRRLFVLAPFTDVLGRTDRFNCARHDLCCA